MTQPTPNKVLLVGGPRHGEEVLDQGPTVQLLAVPTPEDPRQPVAAVAVTYIKRYVGGIIEGRKRQRDVYVFQGVQNEQEMAALLTNFLLGEFIREGGYEIVEGEAQEAQPHNDVPGRHQDGAGQVAGEAPRSASGLYLPN